MAVHPSKPPTAPHTPSPKVVWTARLVCLTAITLCVYHHDLLQAALDHLYAYLLSTWIFNSVYFETVWTVTVNYPILLVPLLMDWFRVGERYKIDKNMRWEDHGLKIAILEAVEYAAPLLFLDTFMVKKYPEVDPEQWKIRRHSWIQTTRALPDHAPTVFQVTYQLLGAFILYDVMFYLVHVTLHKNLWLYKYIHSRHHDHSSVQSRVTNRLAIPERIILVLSANQALKFMRAHPLTRTIFVPLFIGWLTENHSGYDFPWTLDKVVPWGLVGGSPYHYQHHEHGTPHYQPFFTYIDRYFSRKTKAKS